VIIQIIIALILNVINIGVTILILKHIQTDGIQTIHIGGWLPTFGISFVADGFAVLLVLTANNVTTVCLMFAAGTIGEKREKLYFYPFVLFLLGGVNGSFLTGDLFNLFVTFEV